MIIYEPRQQLQVNTPKGKGRVYLITEYGTEIEKIFTVIIDATGEIWEFGNQDINATRNKTMGRGEF
jgi:hypothetical protein|tara:strand:+ start:563 stop:763 length:201 start_codon:yes stop_codon:yes gene_type:complete